MLLHVPERVGSCPPLGARDEHTVPPSCDRALERCVAVNDLEHDRRASGHSEQHAVDSSQVA